MFTKSKTPPTPSPVSKPVRAANTQPSLIAEDVRLTGNISAKGEIQLDGIVEGDVQATTLTIGETGAVKGAINADSVIIKGVVEGQIRCRSVRLEKNAKVKGDLWHETVSIEAGAIVEGHLLHTSSTDTKTNGEKVAKVVGNISDHAAKPAMASAS
jgi:cytoskeletal protein CcmA (bactofilin family)